MPKKACLLPFVFTAILFVSLSASADPLLPAVSLVSGPLTSFNYSATLQQQSGPTIFSVTLNEVWTGLDAGVFLFTNITPGSYIDVTTNATNRTSEIWTSWHSRTDTSVAGALPPIQTTFWANDNGFFTTMASWDVTPQASARCAEAFDSYQCTAPYYGNVFTEYNGSIGQGGTVQIRYVLRVDRGNFTLTQRPGLPGSAPVPEPASVLLLGAGLLVWRARAARLASL